MADETGLHEFPPLRAAWSRARERAVIVISGRNARRVLHGALNVASGELVLTVTVTVTSTTADVAAAVEGLGRVRPDVPNLLVWDNTRLTNRSECARRRRWRGSNSRSCPSERRS